MVRTTALLVAAVGLIASDAALAAPCPPATLVQDQFLCYQSGGVDTPGNAASATYSPTTPFVSGSEVCVQLDAVAEIEAGGYDRVFLRWTDNAGGEQTSCVVGLDVDDCVGTAGGGCLTSPSVVWTLDDTWCYQPTVGATSVGVTLYVQPTDLQYQCGDTCDGGQTSGLGVTVNSLAVTGCTGFPVESCGDGVVGPGEACDDGNSLALDGCSATCQREPGSICNTAGTACTAKNACDAVTPGSLAADYCYANGDDFADSPLAWTWSLAGDGSPVLLHWDLDGGLEMAGPDIGGPFDILWLAWEDDKGGSGGFFLNDGALSNPAKYKAWHRGSYRVTPTAGATTLTVTFYVTTDGATSCQQPKAGLGPAEGLQVNALFLTSCPVGLTTYDTLAAFNAAVGECYLVHDFNALAAGTTGPLTGDGYKLTIDTNKPGAVLTVDDAPYKTTQAEGDGTIAVEAQGFGTYEYNSRLRVAFEPKPAKAVALNLIDAGDGEGVMAIEAWKDGQLVLVANDIQASGPNNNFITWKGLVFSEPVDEVVFFMIESGDFFNIDNLIVQPQADGDGDGVADQCDCAPSNPSVAGSFPEQCANNVDDDCDGLTDGVDPDCGGSGTVTCGDHGSADFVATNGGWLTSGDQSWKWDAAAGVWRGVGKNGIDATLESAPIAIAPDACPELVEVAVDLSGTVQAGSDTLTVSYAVNGGAFMPLDVLDGALAAQMWALPDVGPGDSVSFRFRYQTDATGLGSDPIIAGLSVFSDADLDADGVCDACDCAPETPAYGFDCDADGDGYCAAAAGLLNADPDVADCPADGPGGVGTDCNDQKITANPGIASEAGLCKDGVDNDCDGATDSADLPECAADDCTDADGDGYGTGTTCLGADCDDTSAECTTICVDGDADAVFDCKDPCIDVDKDGYGVGSGCTAEDCDDQAPGCTTDCVSDKDGNGQPDCSQGCLDVDGDGYGVGPDCLGPDCDDAASGCTTDCATDVNDNGVPDCKEPGCKDIDGDGYGEGLTCLGPDCSEKSVLCTTDCTDTDGDQTPDCVDADDDNDGLPDVDEPTWGTDPKDPDTDDDGLLDGPEVNTHGTEPKNPDTDGDGLLDGAEVNTHGTNPTKPDTDGDGLGDGAEVNTHGTSPIDSDTDDDGLGDGQELNDTKTSPLDPDTDGDDLLDGVEVNDTQTDPLDADTDDDGLGDGQEVNDTQTNPLDPDSDDDELGDGQEVTLVGTDPNDPDTDDGGEPDGSEVANGRNPVDNPADDFGGAAPGLAGGLVQGNGLADCAGGGGATPPWELLMVLLFLLAWRRPRARRGVAVLALAALAALAAPPASAANRDGFGIDSFFLKPGADRVFSVAGSEVAPAWSPYGGLWIHYADDPLRLLRDVDGEVQETRLVEHRLLGQLALGLGLFDLAELELGLPVILGSAGDEALFPGVADAGVGDLTVGLRVRLVGRRGPTREGFGLALGVATAIPTGDAKALGGDGGARIAPRVDLSYAAGPVLVALDLGVSIRTSRDPFENLDLDQDLSYGLGVRWQVVERLALGAEIFGRTRLTNPFAEESESPMELVGGPTVQLVDGLTLEVGAGTGVIPGYGAPDWRVFGGLQYAKRLTGPKDTDGDGLTDDVDQCPLEPEDKDRFQDEDGCPDPDNDGDGVPDVRDRCPLDPEDPDGFQDADGCPDPDNDGDGIADARDACPLQPEDPDGFQDEDGCPDPDNDGDGILDDDDKCMNDPETVNGFEDDDGCPDEKPLARLEGCRIEIGDRVYFNTNKATIKPISFPLLDAVAQIIAANVDSIERVEVQGHTDSVGSAGYNRKLSQQRADSVRKYLAGQGVPAAKLRAKGYGEDQPIAPNDNEDGRAQNRRVEFHVVGGKCAR